MDVRHIPIYANILLWILHEAVVGALVLPPTNVTFHCHNLSNTLSWGYDGPVDGVTFQVIVRSRRRQPETIKVEPPNMSIDLSEFSDPNNDYAVFVKAVEENAESAEAPDEGIQYSYFQDSLVTKICDLDLPLVNVTTLDENHLHYSFTHPAVLYPPSQRHKKKRSHESSERLPVFDYHIDILNQGTHSMRHHCTERQCEGDLQVHGSQKSYCLNISGELRKMSVRATKMYCSTPLEPAKTSPLAYIIPIALVVVGGGFVIGYMIFVKRTTPSTTGPSALSFPGLSRRQQQNHAPAVSPEYAFVAVEPSSPEPLIPPEQDTSNSSTFRDDLHFPLRVPNNDRGDNDNDDAIANDEPEQEEEAAGAQEAQEGAQKGAGDGYTQGNALEEDEEEEEPRSAYERREKIVQPQD